MERMKGMGLAPGQGVGGGGEGEGAGAGTAAAAAEATTVEGLVGDAWMVGVGWRREGREGVRKQGLRERKMGTRAWVWVAIERDDV